jgi:ABC-type transport system involved in multi-copper enzyme maturation permease subunit
MTNAYDETGRVGRKGRSCGMNPALRPPPPHPLSITPPARRVVRFNLPGQEQNGRVRGVIFLPIAERELRVAARKPGTVRTRVLGVAIALGMTLLFLGLWFFDPSTFRGPGHGQILFNVLIWLFFFFAIASGLFLTSDAISEEKREGTIGLLFLTDLKGYDVVIGKLAAGSLIGFYSLLAVFPVLAIPFLMGGVTGTEFWKSALALLSTMILSVGAGLVVSVCSRDGQRSMFVTFGLLAVITVGSMTIDSVRRSLDPVASVPLCSLISPAFLLGCAERSSGTHYWQAFIANQVVSGLFFLLAILLAPHWWQDRGTARNPAATAGAATSRRRWLRPAVPPHRRTQLLFENPILWLGKLEFWPPRLAVAWSLVLALGLGAQLALGDSDDLVGWSFVGGLTLIPLYLLAAQSPRFHIDARQSGWLELLLSTPITTRQVIQGQWRSWVRRFAPALIAISLLQMVLTLSTTYQIWASMNSAAQAATVATPPPPPAGTNTSATANAPVRMNRPVRPAPRFGWESWILSFALAACNAAATLLNLAAVVWFGMWTGLKSRKTTVASMKVLVIVQIIPALLFHFLSFILLPVLMLFGSGGSSFSMQWHLGLIFGTQSLLAILKDVGFILWSRHRLYRELRQRATGELHPGPRRRLKLRPA